MVKELTKENYKELVEDSDKVLFIDFYSPSCGPCQQLLPFLKTMDEHFKDKNVQILKCNTSVQFEIAQKYLIRSVPTTVVIDLDKNVKNPILGLATPDQYISVIEKEFKTSFFDKLFKKKK